MMRIDEMPAGRELNALVAEKVMGWIEIGNAPNERLKSHLWGKPSSAAMTTIVPFYSTDIAAAWEVVKKMQADRFQFIISDALALPDFTFLPDNHVGIIFSKVGRVIEADEVSSATNISLAICRAALKAIVIEDENHRDCRHTAETIEN